MTNRGSQLIFAILITTLVSVLGSASSGLVTVEIKKSKEKVAAEKAFEIAEAGIEYYRWHLAHVPDDFQDGTGAPGPYIHDFKDASGAVIGRYSLNIAPPQSGSTVVAVESTGFLLDNPNRKRKIAAKFGIPSLSSYAVVANDVMRFGSGTEVFGPIHSNNGIRFDGLTHNLITSTVSQYDDPDSDDCNGNLSFGVHTCRTPADPRPPASVPARTDVFQVGRDFPAPQIDFNGITTDLVNMQTLSLANGLYLSGSSALGYHIRFNADDTMNIYRVTAMAFCRYRQGAWRDYPNIYSIGAESSFILNGRSSLNYPLPANGIIFAEDDLWVDGQINTARVTVVAAREPLASGNASIIINNDLLYTNYDGQDAVGLIAQTDISVGFYSDTDLRIDAALIAQRGRVGRYYYQPRSASYQYNPAGCRANIWKNSITSFGSITTNRRYGFAYTDGTGYNLRTLNFDSNLTFAPPPSFPTTGQYTLLSWEEK
ncbi:hypothetical protein EPN15_02570 [Patescibacteria group bacterium]|nr:MAG: hypothetical protein EPN15_02570 [Patescibacteria group bacterium]